MNPVLIILLFVACTLLWILLSFLYKPIGSIGKRLVEDAKNAMAEDDEKKKNNKRKRRK